jgi:hypothetical protein
MTTTLARRSKRNAAGTTGASRRFFLFFAALLFAALVKSPAAAASANTPHSGSRFAVADFDGDVHPDIARVETGNLTSNKENYSIQLDLSSVGRKSFLLSAPQGGLVIEARDVNRDNTIDLVLATAWLLQPVAVLLNDGHGNFSRVESNAFPHAFDHPNQTLSSSTQSESGSIGAPPRPERALNIELGNNRLSRPPTNSHAAQNEVFAVSGFIASFSGRAPPPAPSYL